MLYIPDSSDFTYVVVVHGQIYVYVGGSIEVYTIKNQKIFSINLGIRPPNIKCEAGQIKMYTFLGQHFNGFRCIDLVTGNEIEVYTGTPTSSCGRLAYVS